MAKEQVADILTQPFRIAFPEVFVPKASVEGGQEKYAITMLFPKDGVPLIPSLKKDKMPPIRELRRLAREAIIAKWGTDKAKWPTNLRALDMVDFLSPAGKDGWPIRDGDMVEWDGFEGVVFARASSKFPPGIVNAKREEIISQGDIFGGLICRAQINAYAYDVSGNKGVSFGLSHIQVLKDDGVSFSGRGKAADVFDAFDDGGTSSDEDDPFA